MDELNRSLVQNAGLFGGIVIYLFVVFAWNSRRQERRLEALEQRLASSAANSSWFESNLESLTTLVEQRDEFVTKKELRRQTLGRGEIRELWKKDIENDKPQSTNDASQNAKPQSTNNAGDVSDLQKRVRELEEARATDQRLQHAPRSKPENAEATINLEFYKTNTRQLHEYVDSLKAQVKGPTSKQNTSSDPRVDGLEAFIQQLRGAAKLLRQDVSALQGRSRSIEAFVKNLSEELNGRVLSVTSCECGPATTEKTFVDCKCCKDGGTDAAKSQDGTEQKSNDGTNGKTAPSQAVSQVDGTVTAPMAPIDEKMVNKIAEEHTSSLQRKVESVLVTMREGLRNEIKDSIERLDRDTNVTFSSTSTYMNGRLNGRFERVEKWCQDLSQALGRMHEEMQGFRSCHCAQKAYTGLSSKNQTQVPGGEGIASTPTPEPNVNGNPTSPGHNIPQTTAPTSRSQMIEGPATAPEDAGINDNGSINKVIEHIDLTSPPVTPIAEVTTATEAKDESTPSGTANPSNEPVVPDTKPVNDGGDDTSRRAVKKIGGSLFEMPASVTPYPDDYDSSDSSDEEGSDPEDEGSEQVDDKNGVEDADKKSTATDGSEHSGDGESVKDATAEKPEAEPIVTTSPTSPGESGGEAKSDEKPEVIAPSAGEDTEMPEVPVEKAPVDPVAPKTGSTAGPPAQPSTSGGLATSKHADNGKVNPPAPTTQPLAPATPPITSSSGTKGETGGDSTPAAAPAEPMELTEENLMALARQLRRDNPMSGIRATLPFEGTDISIETGILRASMRTESLASHIRLQIECKRGDEELQPPPPTPPPKPVATGASSSIAGNNGASSAAEQTIPVPPNTIPGLEGKQPDFPTTNQGVQDTGDIFTEYGLGPNLNDANNPNFDLGFLDGIDWDSFDIGTALADPNFDWSFGNNLFPLDIPNDEGRIFNEGQQLFGEDGLTGMTGNALRDLLQPSASDTGSKAPDKKSPPPKQAGKKKRAASPQPSPGNGTGASSVNQVPAPAPVSDSSRVILTARVRLPLKRPNTSLGPQQPPPIFAGIPTAPSATSAPPRGPLMVDFISKTGTNVFLPSSNANKGETAETPTAKKPPGPKHVFGEPSGTPPRLGNSGSNTSNTGGLSTLTGSSISTAGSSQIPGPPPPTVPGSGPQQGPQKLSSDPKQALQPFTIMWPKTEQSGDWRALLDPNSPLFLGPRPTAPPFVPPTSQGTSQPAKIVDNQGSTTAQDGGDPMDEDPKAAEGDEDVDMDEDTKSPPRPAPLPQPPSYRPGPPRSEDSWSDKSGKGGSSPPQLSSPSQKSKESDSEQEMMAQWELNVLRLTDPAAQDEGNQGIQSATENNATPFPAPLRSQTAPLYGEPRPGDLYTQKPLRPARNCRQAAEERRLVAEREEKENQRRELIRRGLLGPGVGFSPTSPAAPGNPFNPSPNMFVDPSQLHIPGPPMGTASAPIKPIVLPPNMFMPPSQVQIPRPPIGPASTPINPVVLPTNMTGFGGLQGGHLSGSPIAPPAGFDFSNNPMPIDPALLNGPNQAPIQPPTNAFQYPPASRRNSQVFPPFVQPPIRPYQNSPLGPSPTSPTPPGGNISPDNPFANFTRPSPLGPHTNLTDEAPPSLRPRTAPTATTGPSPEAQALAQIAEEHRKYAEEEKAANEKRWAEQDRDQSEKLRLDRETFERNKKADKEPDSEPELDSDGNEFDSDEEQARYARINAELGIVHKKPAEQAAKKEERDAEAKAKKLAAAQAKAKLALKAKKLAAAEAKMRANDEAAKREAEEYYKDLHTTEQKIADVERRMAANANRSQQAAMSSYGGLHDYSAQAQSRPQSMPPETEGERKVREAREKKEKGAREEAEKLKADRLAEGYMTDSD